MSEKDLTFDRMLEDSLTALPPPEETVKQTNPWKKPMGYIAWGFALTTFHLGMLYLDYILPIVGMLLLYFGTRSLRRENKCFCAAWGIAAAYGLCYALSLFLNTQPPTDYLLLAVTAAGTALQFLFLLVLRAGVRQVFRKVEEKQESDPLLWAFVWLILIVLIAFSPLAQSWLAFIPMLIAFVLIVRAMYNLGKSLGDTGYYLSDAPVRVRGAVVSAVYVAATVALVVVGCIYANHLPLEAEPYTGPAMTAARQALLDQGFPEDALECLSEDDVMLMQGAISVETQTETLMFDPKRIQYVKQTWSGTHYSYVDEPGEINIEETTIFVELPERELYVMHYFEWLGGDPVWQNNIEIWPVDLNETVEVVDSSLLYLQKNTKMRATIPRIGCETVNVDAWLAGEQARRLITGAFSYPFGTTQQRGYVLYHEVYTEGILVTWLAFECTTMKQPIHLNYGQFKGYYVMHDMNYEPKAPRETIE